MILCIDNYDSFIFNLARYCQRLGQETVVLRNDAVTVEQITAMNPDAIIISPGPCTPKEAGCSVEIVRALGQKVPILGVCLGHQVIAAAFGAKIVRAAEPMHGRISQLQHDGRGVFAGLPEQFDACRYHSLVVDETSLSKELEVSARIDDGTIMALRHRTLPLIGLQFHPESILTANGYALLANFFRLAGLADAEADATSRSLADELDDSTPAVALPEGPVTF